MQLPFRPRTAGALVQAGNYIVTVGLGTPKKDLSLIFDTGSDLTWTQCEPCVRSCYKQKDPTFDPSQSTSYTNISCGSSLCNSLASATGNTLNCDSSTCVYGIQYGDSSFSVGFFGKERLTLTPTEAFDNFYFGCGQNNQGLFGGSAGLLGLGRDPLSLVSQTSRKYNKLFSYCLPSSSSSTGFLTFGGYSSNPLNSHRYPQHLPAPPSMASTSLESASEAANCQFPSQSFQPPVESSTQALSSPGCHLRHTLL
ncbi:hypothetical protein GH714_008888 [Hevea brasiliensis]|uniref:Peptidase A1 domain-containing protein n=1 Tax=Hevea brasiliensis TaxID=3981 RepID=A0A6A6MJB9_HEVBR|nr:hypothetical protein GH714_008888 [Hevea brasiliensis]